jgi:hypothetical protein
MPDTSLGRALAELVDDVEAGDSLRERVARRERRGWRRPRLLAVAAVVVLALVGGMVVVANRRDEQRKTPVVTKPDRDKPSMITPQAAGGSWTPIAPAPDAARILGARVWTGTEVLFWGGADPGEQTNGVAYDPATDSWRTLPPAPIAPDRSDPAYAWTGSEFIVWGGALHSSIGVQRDGAASGGAAFDPQANTWRTLPDAPIAPRSDAAFGWTGREFVVWGGVAGTESDGPRMFNDGAAYDPSSNQWRRLPNLGLAPGPARGAASFGSIVVRSFEADATAQVHLDGSDRVERMRVAPRRFLGEWAMTSDMNGVYSWGWTDRSRTESERDFLGWWTLDEDGVWTPIRGNETTVDAPDAGVGGGAYALEEGFLIFGQHIRFSSLTRSWLQLPHSGLEYEGCCLAVIDTGDALLVWSGAESPTPGARYEAGGDTEYPTAIWPAPTTQGAWRNDPAATAERFATEVLGWPNAEVAAGPGPHGTIVLNSEGRVLTLFVANVRGDDKWSIVHAFTGDGFRPPNTSLAINESVTYVHLPQPAGAVTVTITYGRGDRVETKDGPEATFAPGDLSQPGYLLGLARDGSGTVVGVWGIVLEPGKI